MEKLDKADIMVLNELARDSRQSFRQIASKTGLSLGTVANRFKKLVKSGAVRGFTAEFDYERLGYDVQVIVEMKIARGKLLEVEKKVAADKSVHAVFDVTGDKDAVIMARFKNVRALDSFIKKLLLLEFVEGTETKLILNSFKKAALLP